MRPEIVLPPSLNYLYPWQELVVQRLLEPASPANQIVLLPTGAGKSLCFQLPAPHLPGLTVVVFPLLALLSDQLRRLRQLGIASGCLRGGQTRTQRQALQAECQAGQVRVLVTTPESLLQDRHLTWLGRLPISHLVIDEAHCICEWGQDFRPDYRRLGEVRRRLQPEHTSAFTATASERIVATIRDSLFDGQAVDVLQANPDRPNISYFVRPSLAKLWDCRRILQSRPGQALIFQNSRVGVRQTAQRLQAELPDRPIRFYHAGLTRDEKDDLETWFRDCQDAILCTTTAFGMG